MTIGRPGRPPPEGPIFVQDLTLDIAEAEQALNALRLGEIDAVVAKMGTSLRVLFLTGADRAHQVLIETLNEGAMTTLLDGTIVFANGRLADLLGRPISEVRGAPLSAFVTSNDATRLSSLLVEAAQGRARGEVSLARADGVAIPVMLSVRAVKGEGMDTALTAVVTDLREIKQAQAAMLEANDELSRSNERLHAEIAERERLQASMLRATDELREASERKDEFLSMLAHELRNPLAPILCAVDLLRSPVQNLPFAEHYRALIERQVRTMARLLDDLLDVSRVTLGVITLRKQPVELTALVRRTMDTVSHLVGGDERQVALVLPPEPIWLDADPTRIEQMLLNVLQNAAKFTDRGDRIAVTACRKGDEVVLEVSDTGRGIAPDLLPHIFELFVQGDHSLNRVKGGLGIGLTVVKRLAELHGGSIQVHSKGRGQGSTFTLTLPTLNVAPGSAHVPLASEVEPDVTEISSGSKVDTLCSAAAPIKVLIVEDHADVALMLCELLKSWDYQVTVAFDGEDALCLAQSLRPDIAIVDIGLPGMDGYEVARRLRSSARAACGTATSEVGTEPPNTRTRGPLLIAMSGYGQERDRQRARDAGFDCHLLKPADPDALKRILRLGRAGL